MFKKIFFINLDKDKTRKEKIECVLLSIFPKIQICRFEAIDRNYVQINHKEIRRAALDGPWEAKEDEPFKKPGAIACYYSHKKILETIQNEYEISKKDDLYLVLEDDCIIPPNFQEFISNIINAATFDWWILKPNNRKSDPDHEVFPGFYKTGLSRKMSYEYYFGAHMLIYRASAVEKIITQIEAHPIQDIDYIINKLIDNVYAFEIPHSGYITQSNEGGSNTTDGYEWSYIKNRNS